MQVLHISHCPPAGETMGSLVLKMLLIHSSLDLKLFPKTPSEYLCAEVGSSVLISNHPQEFWRLMPVCVENNELILHQDIFF